MTTRTAIILAAGRGSRLMKHTRNRPKCLTKLGGRRLLDWQLLGLRAAGIQDVVLVGGYRAGMLSNVANVDLVENGDWHSTGPVASLRCANPEKFASGFIVVYGDCVFHPDWISKLSEAREDIAITSDVGWRDLWSLRFDDIYADAERLRHAAGALVEIGGGACASDDIHGQFTGLLKFTQRGWASTRSMLDTIAPQMTAAMDMTTLLSHLLAHGATIGVVPIDGRWCEVDSDNDLNVYRKLLRRRSWRHDWRWQGVGVA
ncbi:MAG TPA: phosphocholine cytidylyltransferase family protein [Rudaea sp.]|jgi:choline kinase|nr:phosphocholine cytidylyltransferase family protein [Rudaea sp.]